LCSVVNRADGEKTAHYSAVRRSCSARCYQCIEVCFKKSTFYTYLRCESSPKCNHLVPGSCPTPPRNFVKICSQLFFSYPTGRQTDRQTDRSKTSPSSSAEVMNLFGVLNSITDVRGRSNEFRTFRHAARRAVYYSICLVRERHTGLAASRIAVRVSP